MDSKVCTIGIKNGIGPSGFLHGWVLESLDPCCRTFMIWFEDTGNTKITSFNLHPTHQERNGFNLTSSRSEPALELRIDNDPSMICKVVSVNNINFCPFCGSKIEIKIVKTVKLVDKFEQKRVGYEEVVLHPIAGK